MAVWDRDSIPALALQLTPKFEGDVLHPYRDSTGVWTIGIGSTTMPDGTRVTGGSPDLTMEQSLQLLGKQEARWVDVVTKVITVPLSETWAAVLIDFVHNEGPNALPGSMIVKMLNAGRADLAAAQLSGWIVAGKTKLVGLARRREAERRLVLGMGDLDACYKAAWGLSLLQLLPAYNQAFMDAQKWNRGLFPKGKYPASATPTPPASAPDTTDSLNDKSAQGLLHVGPGM